jgi:thiamine kinase-like enzyme
MKIKGHSEFIVKLIEWNDKKVISKSSDEKNKERLKKQIEKQKFFYSNYMLKFEAKTVKILLDNDKEYLMEYIYFSENVIDYIQLGNITKIDWLINKMINVVEKYISFCKMEYIDEEVLLNKIKSVDEKIKNNSYINYEDSYIKDNLKYLYNNSKTISKVKIPIGLCHGDLTFSNILVDSSEMKIYLIDFLDSFIETPLFDIVKLRQDTKFNWIMKMYEGIFDKNSCLISLDYMDLKLDNYFKKYDYYKGTYLFYEKLNILRIIQYSKDNSNLIFFKNRI